MINNNHQHQRIAEMPEGGILKGNRRREEENIRIRTIANVQLKEAGCGKNTGKNNAVRILIPADEEHHQLYPITTDHNYLDVDSGKAWKHGTKTGKKIRTNICHFVSSS